MSNSFNATEVGLRTLAANCWFAAGADLRGTGMQSHAPEHIPTFGKRHRAPSPHEVQV